MLRAVDGTHEADFGHTEMRPGMSPDVSQCCSVMEVCLRFI